MKVKVLILLFLLPLFAFPNNDVDSIKLLNNKLNSIESRFNKIDRNLRQMDIRLSSKNKELLVQIDSVNNKIKNNEEALKAAYEKFGIDIYNTKNELSENKSEIFKNIDVKSYTGLGLIALVGVIILFIYFLLKRNISTSSSSIDSIKEAQKKIEEAQSKMQEESLNLDSKIVNLFEKQMQTEITVSRQSGQDHSLALKVADEVARIELNLSRMDPSIKGFRQLVKAIERIKNNFMAQGYEFVDMLGKTYEEGMVLEPNFVIDENLPKGIKIITSVSKPQLNYNGKMIQKAIVTVSQNI